MHTARWLWPSAAWAHCCPQAK